MFKKEEEEAELIDPTPSPTLHYELFVPFMYSYCAVHQL